jgi:hypothetical protein
MGRRGVRDYGYLSKTGTHWRMRAEKMRALAEETHDPTVRAMMLRFATNYDRVAGQAADRRRNSRSNGWAMMLRFGANYERIARQGAVPAPQDSIMFRGRT